MLKFLFVILTIITLPTLSANSFNISVHSGIMNLEEIDSGVSTGVVIGTALAPTWEGQLSLSYYNSEHQTARNIARTMNPPNPAIKTTVDITSTFIPIMLGIQNKIPLTNQITPFIGASFGWSFLNEDVTILDPDYLYPGYDSYSNYNGLVTSAWTGLQFRVLNNVELLGKISYLYSKLSSQLDLQREGFTKNDLEIHGLGFQAGIQYNFR